jgi:hypothetical protein
MAIDGAEEAGRGAQTDLERGSLRITLKSSVLKTFLE